VIHAFGSTNLDLFAGVDLSRPAMPDAATGCAGIFTDAEGRNQIVVAPDANSCRGNESHDRRAGRGNPMVINEHEGSWCGDGDAAVLHARPGVGVVRTQGATGAEWTMSGSAGCVPAYPMQAIKTTTAGA
jgi:sugar/nucleoside kinase (ribokinase family)